MAKENPNEMMVATESGSAIVDGVELRFYAGRTRVTRSHALVKNFPDWFAPLEFEAPTETATAEPGEKRATK